MHAAVLIQIILQYHTSLQSPPSLNRHRPAPSSTSQSAFFFFEDSSFSPLTLIKQLSMNIHT
jgi:hypothetical protein